MHSVAGVSGEDGELPMLLLLAFTAGPFEPTLMTKADVETMLSFSFLPLHFIIGWLSYTSKGHSQSK